MRVAFIVVIAAVVFTGWSAPASGQELSARDKDPAIALGFAWLCPGCGHLYSGETTKGAVIAAISVGSLAGGAAIQLTRRPQISCTGTGARRDCTSANLDLTPILVGGAIGLAAYLYGLIDAGPSAKRMNSIQGLGVRGIDVQPSVASDGSVGTQFMIRLSPAR